MRLPPPAPSQAPIRLCPAMTPIAVRFPPLPPRLPALPRRLAAFGWMFPA